MKNKSSEITQAALIAAIYVVLTIFSNLFGLASGVIQIRLSEALTILPVFTPAAVPGLVIGCILSNTITGCLLPDIIFGSLATLVGALATARLREHRWLASLPPIVANTLIIPWILSIAYSFEGSVLYFTVTIFIGEIISAGVIGQFLYHVLEPHAERLGWRKPLHK